MDRRQRRTRKAVFDAFTKLLGEKPYSRITVQDIIDEADIGRSTFYAHFETKDELLVALCDEIFSHVFSGDVGAERTHDFSEQHDFADEICHLLYHLRESGSYIRGLLANEGGEVFMRSFKGHLRQQFDRVVDAPDSAVPRDYLLNHLVCDFAETVRWWMGNDGYTPEEVCSFFMATASIGA